MQKIRDFHFEKEPIENNGKYSIHPLTKDGFRVYISPKSYNYHFLHENGDDPNIANKLMQEVRREVDEERRQALLMEGGGINYNVSESSENDIINNNNTFNKKKKKGENFIGDYYQVTYTSKKTSKNPYLEKKNVKTNLNKKNVNKGLTVGKKSGNKLVQCENGIKSSMPSITHVNAGRGILKEYPAPHIN